ncbi:hypothetical protein NDU88_006621 [Pleurodeles waltl]|uniref:Uncharacterized protein n=1 Tax=Pleurodeles waltl TaxID=8319 RepID=A0AAV7WG60_PLEWA|nr:hypothetical protein NDU88_006621 [Pleurodeles waltl]
MPEERIAKCELPSTRVNHGRVVRWLLASLPGDGYRCWDWLVPPRAQMPDEVYTRLRVHTPQGQDETTRRMGSGRDSSVEH